MPTAVRIGNAEDAVGGRVRVFNAAVGAMKDNGHMKVADQGAEAFFTVAESFGGTALFGEVGERDDHAG